MGQIVLAYICMSHRKKSKAYGTFEEITRSVFRNDRHPLTIGSLASDLTLLNFAAVERKLSSATI